MVLEFSLRVHATVGCHRLVDGPQPEPPGQEVDVSAAGENLHGERELAGGCEGRCGWKSGMPSRAARWMWTQPRSDSEPASRPTRGSWRPGQERPGDKRRQGPR